MIEGLPDVPPAFVLMLGELHGVKSPVDARRRVRGMLKDLRQQSEMYERESAIRSRYPQRSLSFDIHLHGALDLLSGDGCQELPCRVQAADRLGRSVGLIADHVWLTDLLTEKFLEPGRMTNERLDSILDDVLVLSRLLPLIAAGIVRFRSPWLATCAPCSEEFQRRVLVATADVLSVFRSEFRIRREPNGNLIGDTGDCFDPSIVYRMPGDGEMRPSTKRFAESVIHTAVRSALWVAREASLSHGVVFSNSRAGIAGLLQCDGRLSGSAPVLVSDEERSFNVPWVSDLSAEQIVELRDLAAKALPAFREKMRTVLTAASPNDAADLIAELREGSAAVRSELEAKRSNSAKFWKATYGLFGLGLCAYGLASEQVLPGAGGLLSVMHLLISHRTGYEADVAKLAAQPSYVLVKAQDLLAHADSSYA